MDARRIGGMAGTDWVERGRFAKTEEELLALQERFLKGEETPAARIIAKQRPSDSFVIYDSDAAKGSDGRLLDSPTITSSSKTVSNLVTSTIEVCKAQPGVSDQDPTAGNAGDEGGRRTIRAYTARPVGYDSVAAAKGSEGSEPSPPPPPPPPPVFAPSPGSGLPVSHTARQVLEAAMIPDALGIGKREPSKDKGGSAARQIRAGGGGKGGGEEQKEYQPLPVLGSIKEKGFFDNVRLARRVRLPEPAVLPFPVARHRSAGPHWVPAPKPSPENRYGVSQAVVPQLSEMEVSDVGQSVDVAIPIVPKRRSKDVSKKLSKFGRERREDSGDSTARKNGESAGCQQVGGADHKRSSRRVHLHEHEQQRSVTSKEDGDKRRSGRGVEEGGALERRERGKHPSVGKTNLPEEEPEKERRSGEIGQRVVEKTLGGCQVVGRESSHQGEDREGRREEEEEEEKEGVVFRNDKERSGRMVAAGVDGEAEQVDAENRSLIGTMSAADIAEMQAELAQKLSPKLLTMLRKRGAEKAAKRMGAKEGETDPKTRSRSLPTSKGCANTDGWRMGVPSGSTNRVSDAEEEEEEGDGKARGFAREKDGMETSSTRDDKQTSMTKEEDKWKERKTIREEEEEEEEEEERERERENSYSSPSLGSRAAGERESADPHRTAMANRETTKATDALLGVEREGMGGTADVSGLRFSLDGEVVPHEVAREAEEILGLTALKDAAAARKGKQGTAKGTTSKAAAANDSMLLLSSSAVARGAGDDDEGGLDLQEVTARHVAERDLLRSEGDPARAGYSLKEATSLARSTVPAQRAAALRLIAAVLSKAACVAGKESPGPAEGCGDADWSAIWGYAFSPAVRLGVTLRISLDDPHATVVGAAALALQAALTCTFNEAYFDIQEANWRGEEALATAPVFRKRTLGKEGLIGAGRWKYMVKGVLSLKGVREDEGGGQEEIDENQEDKETVGDDATMACRDFAGGLIRMGVLPRIRYILEVMRISLADEPLLDVLIGFCRHSPGAAEAVMRCPRLIETVRQRFIIDGQQWCSPIPSTGIKAIKLLKVLCLAGRDHVVILQRSGLLQSCKRHLLLTGIGESMFEKSTSGPPEKGGGRNMVQMVPERRLRARSESFRLWRACVRYGLDVSVFSEYYAGGVCWFLIPPRLCNKDGGENFNKKDDDQGVAAWVDGREAYLLLEGLATTLLPLGGTQKAKESSAAAAGEKDNDLNLEIVRWLWSIALPLSQTACEWLQPEILAEALGRGSNGAGNEVQGGQTWSHAFAARVGAISAVVHFLATVVERASAGSDADELRKPSAEEGVQSRHNNELHCAVVERIHTSLVKGGVIRGENVVSVEAKDETWVVPRLVALAERGERDVPSSIAATSCLRAILRLTVAIGSAMPAQTVGVLCSNHSIFCELLEKGIRKVVTQTLGRILWGHQSGVNSNTRGGTAPGVGLGWFIKDGGGLWTERGALLQEYARLLGELLVAVAPLDWERSSKGTTMHRDLSLNNKEMKVSELLDGALGILECMGPNDRELVRRVICRVVLAEEPCRLLNDQMTHYLRQCHRTIEIGPGMITKHSESIRRAMIRHYIREWLSVRRKPIGEQQQPMVNASSISSAGRRGSPLRSITENETQGEETCSEQQRKESGEDREDVDGPNRKRLMHEWINQRLPLPSHWLLSPMAIGAGLMELGAKAVKKMEKEGAMVSLAKNWKEVELAVKGCLSTLMAFELLGLQQTKRIPFGRKVHALSEVFLMGTDFFIDSDIRALLKSLQELIFGNQKKHQGQHGDDEMNFARQVDTAYEPFIESLAEHFSEASFGDEVFARQISAILQPKVTPQLRLTLWSVLADAQVLPLLPPVESCCGSPNDYLFPLERDAKVLDAYVAAWSSGKLDRAAEKNSLPFTLAIHHLSGFIFSSADKNKVESQECDLHVKRIARILVRSCLRRPNAEHLLLRLLRFGLPSPHTRSAPQADGHSASDAVTSHASKEIGGWTAEETSLSCKEGISHLVQHRLDLLRSTCVQENELLEKINSIQRVLAADP